MRPFKGIICNNISEFESYMPSQPVRLEEKRLLLELARTWAQAAVASDSTTVVVNYTQAKHRAAL